MALTGSAIGKSSIQISAGWYRQSRRFVSLSMGRVSYVERGSGHVALFLHGFPLNGFQWRGSIERLASKQRRCIAPDFMALGYSEASNSQQITPVAQADMLAEFLDALKIRVVDVVANDSGGEVAQLFLVRHPGRIRSLLLTNCDVFSNNPPPSFKPLVVAAQKGVLADSFERLLAEKALARSPQGLGPFYTNPSSLTEEAIDYYFSPIVSSPNRKAQFNNFAAALGENVLVAIEQDLRRSQVPVRIVWGEADTTFDVTWADWLDKALPQSRGIRRLPGAKLFFPEEMPDIIAEESIKLWDSA